MLSLSILLPAAALTRYDDHGEPSYTPQERVLIALRRMGWASKPEINDALGIIRDENITQALVRLVRSGKVERRGRRAHYEYRIHEPAFAPKPRFWRCRECKRKRVSKRKFCQKHLDYQAAYQRKRWAARKAKT